MTSTFRAAIGLLGSALFACEPAAAAPRELPAQVASPSSPLGALEQADLAPQWTGVVAEQLHAGTYAYLAIRDRDELHWVAVMGPGHSPGTRVAVHTLGVRHDFHSPRLDRDFDELVFATVEVDPTPMRTTGAPR